jgi:hypothetical protein
MPAVVQTGRSLTLEINSVDVSVQTAEVTLTPSQTVDQYITLSSSAAKAQPVTWALTVRAFQDWGEATSFAEAMVTAAAAGTSIPFELALSGGGTATGDIVPTYPNVGGAADAALEMDLEFQVDGDVTFTF